MREEKLSFGIVVRVLVSLLPILLGFPTLAVIMCAYNLAMSFIVFGPLTAFVSSLCAVCISMLLSGLYGPSAELTGLVLAAQAILCAAGCIYGLPYKKKFYGGLCLATLGILIPQLLYTQYSANEAGMTVAQALVPSVETVKLMMSEIMGSLQQEIDLSIIEEAVEAIRSFSTMLIPSTLIISSMVIAYIVAWAVSLQLRKLPIGMIHSFSHIKVSRVTSVCSVILIILAVTAFSISNKMLLMVSLNMLVILLTMCFFSGISLADFYLRKFIPYTIVRILIHGLISLNIFPVYILAAFVDSFVNFRKLPITHKKGGEALETEE